MLERANVRVLALDRDPRAIEASGPMQQAFGDRLILRHSRFSQFQKIAIEAGLAAPGQPARQRPPAACETRLIPCG